VSKQLPAVTVASNAKVRSQKIGIIPLPLDFVYCKDSSCNPSPDSHFPDSYRPVFLPRAILDPPAEGFAS
jgi:hypothetical protein